MIARPKNSIHTYPMHRVIKVRERWELLRFVGVENAKSDNIHRYYDEPVEFPEVVASTTSREAMMACLRLGEVEEYEDWDLQETEPPASYKSIVDSDHDGLATDED